MTSRSKTASSRIRKVTVTVAKGLSLKDGRAAAYRAARRKAGRGYDCRAIGYDPNTGKGWTL
ncbi:hypothetical protein WV31_07315 [Magnetospirillum sp. ME-1]|uniref:hypothetical protein n=1 Tax=Magnetospirillum sp. ME-1 TaxID=1639348 RepID=UPI000A17A086|nr:hypothetical protein [Magnetospirillum sp. ME-1]ARJ65473.1 hypothetical protein WV31_07315 [Magnetospirillum sp. ME-1]